MTSMRLGPQETVADACPTGCHLGSEGILRLERTIRGACGGVSGWVIRLIGLSAPLEVHSLPLPSSHGAR